MDDAGLGMRIEGLTRTLVGDFGPRKGKLVQFMRRQRREMRKEVLRRAGVRGGR